VTYPFAKAVTYVDRSVTGQDSDGNDTYTETQTATTAVFAPGGSAELTSGGDTVTTQPTLYGVDTALPVKATDRFIIDGLSFEVDGDPQKYDDPFTGWQPGLVVPLRRVTG
jgi:hypothetical protein